MQRRGLALALGCKGSLRLRLLGTFTWWSDEEKVLVLVFGVGLAECSSWVADGRHGHPWRLRDVSV